MTRHPVAVARLSALAGLGTLVMLLGGLLAGCSCNTPNSLDQQYCEAYKDNTVLPAFIVAEATLSFVGLGFPGTSPSWGVLLQDAAGGRILAEAPWLIAPAAAIAATTLAINLVGAHTPLSRQDTSVSV